MFRLLAASLATVLLTACSQAPLQPPAPLGERLQALGLRQGEEVRRITAFSISGWRSLDDSHLILDAGPGRDYLITLAYPCYGLDSRNRIGYTTTGGALTDLDRILAPEPGMPRDCPIREITRLEKLN